MKFGKRTNPWVYFFVIIFIMVTIFYISSPLKKGFGFLTGPLYKKISPIFSRFESNVTLQAENNQLNSELEKIQPMIKHEMENAFKMAVPLDVEIGLGKNWLEAH